MGARSKGVLVAFLGVVLIFGTSGIASAVDCASITNLAQLVALGSAGCTSQDKIFNNFTTNLSGATQSLVSATVHFQPGTGQDQHGWTFAGNGSLNSSFTLSYDIAVLPGNPGVSIFESIDQMFDGIVPFNVQIVDTQTPGVLNLNGASNAGLTAQIGPYAGLQAIHTSSVVTIGAGNLLNSYEQIWIEQVAAVPEPGTMLLLGTGLVTLFGVARRRLQHLV